MRFIVFVFSMLALVFVGFNADAQTGDYDPNLSIDFSDYDTLLRETVLVNGRSTRRPAPRPIPPTGRRIVRGNKAATRWETNRVMFHMLTGGGQDLVHQMRSSLEVVPDETPLQNFHPDERLAYWLNLRNLVVYEALMDAYPISRLNGFWEQLVDDKRLVVSGRAMSIGDIEDHIKITWPNPVVIYGFYNGAIGGPNIRIRAYSRDRVWDYLESNARDFVGSLRGLQFDDEVAEVSTFYEHHRDVFPNFESDLKTHMMEFADPLLVERIRATDEIELEINDWYIADLYGGRFSSGSSAMVGPSGLLTAGGGGASGILADAMEMGMNELALQGYPDHVKRFLQNWVQRNYDRNRGVVTIDEIDSDTTVIVPGEDDEGN